MEGRELLVANLALIERAVSFTCRRNGLEGAEAEDFASTVKLRLVENDYAILRKFEGRSTFATFIAVVVQRMLLDYRVHEWGKWHASAEAKRMGEAAVEAEKLLHRDGRTMQEALPLVRRIDPAITPEALEQIASRLPERRPRRRSVDVSEAETIADSRAPLDDVLTDERQETSRRVSSAMREIIGRLPEHDRLILQLRFECQFTVAQIARSLQIEQKLLYRRIERLMRDLRAELERAGIDPREVADLIGREGAELDFTLGNPSPRPSNKKEGPVAAREEVSP